MAADPEPQEAPLSLPVIWVGLQASQEAWRQAAPADRATIDDSDLSVLGSVGIKAQPARSCEVGQNLEHL